MALISCPNCGSKISDTAKHCPKCGVQLKRQSVNKKNKTALYALFAVLGVLVLIVGGTIAYSDYAEKKEKKEAQVKLEKEKAEAIFRRDSLEQDLWQKTLIKDDEEAYRLYLKKFPEGKHADQAQKRVEREEKKKLTADEEESVANTISSFFNNLANEYEDEMLACLNPSLSLFLGKKNATKVDAVSFMKHMHAADVYSIRISLDSSEIQISKSLGDSDTPTYSADFSYDQRIEREDTSKETFASISGHAVLNEDYKITSLSLKKISSY